MFKKILCILIVLIGCIQPAIGLEVSSEAYIMIDLENENIIYEKNSKDERYVASLTKLMAILVAIENIDNLQDKIEVDGEVIKGYSEYSKVGLKDGDVVTYEDLLYGMMLPSGADAALLITHHVAGDEQSFATLMNKKAMEIGMRNSRFDNAVGRDSQNNYSTAYDIALLLKYALKNETFYRIFTAREYKIEHLDIEMKNTLNYYSRGTNLDTTSIMGSKTGYTSNAGFCLASLTYHDEHPVILVNLGSDDDYRYSAIQDSLTIYEDFKDNYQYKEVLSTGQEIIELPVKLGWKKTYTITMPETVYGFVDENSELKTSFVGVEELNKKIKKGDFIGKIEVYQNDFHLATYELHLQDTVFYHYPVIYAVVLLLLTLVLYKKYLTKKKRRRRRR